MGLTSLKDKALIQAFIERWRPETHTFHMPVGEMTVTLQDVGCILGLPVFGETVTGIAYSDWRPLLENCLGRPIPAHAWRKSVARRGFGWSLKLSWLREEFRELPQNPTPLQVAYYTRAYLLDFFVSVLFPTSSGDDVPVMYIQFLTNLDNPVRYNWGGAVLAHLYKALSVTAQKERTTFTGCVDLLQLWIWTRFSTCRPKKARSGIEFSEWGFPNLDDCMPYGRRWTGPRLWENVHHAGIGPARDMLEKLEDDRGVVWTPYDGVLDRLPRITQDGRPFWYCRVPQIHLWIVQMYYPDRVMRHFGFRQTVPPPAPIDWTDELEYERVDNVKYPNLNYDWSIHWANEVQVASQPNNHVINVIGPHDDHLYRK
jgi:hypothetical protein